MPEFVTEAVLKRDVFSETHKGHFAGRADEKVIRRIVSAAPWWSRPLAWILARREIAALRVIKGMAGVPQLFEVDADGLYRSWTDGAPIQLARPSDPEWYRGAHRLLRELRRRSITHNDLAKPQNWLSTPEGTPSLIDFQLASRHRFRTAVFRLMAYEDFRHLLKQKRAFAPHLLTPTGARILARRSLPSRIWMASGKKVYNFVTRRLFDWSDGEGTFDRVEREGPDLIRALKAEPGVRDACVTAYPLPAKGVGVYAFVEVAPGTATAFVERLAGAAARPVLIQPVDRLPRAADGTPRMDVLDLIATNRLPEIDRLLAGDADLAALANTIAAGRLNMSDRRLKGTEHVA
ncbi:MAG: serine/threonine protein kinase [Rhizobiaceae bacterium]|nr:serine/threonine protein kinase [Rhizobiaceae bacterium]